MSCVMLEKLQLAQLTQLLSPTNSLRNPTHISVLLTRNINMTSTPLNMNREVYRVAHMDHRRCWGRV